MSYIDNTSVTIQAILTKKGRELLAKGRNEFNITQFGLADDEIDYDLFNPAHPLGTDYYGTIIENMPIVEPVPDETQVMKYKLITLSKKTARIPVVTVSSKNITLNAAGETGVITPQTSNFPNGNTTLGYTAILSDSDAAIIRVAPGNEVRVAVSPTVPRVIGDAESPQSIAVTGKAFEVIAKNQLLQDKNTTITIIGNETGGRVTINLTVKKTTVATSGASATIG
jgi:hypothetical protein